MKTAFYLFFFMLITNTLFAQSISLPYYTGFDSSSERAGWQQFRTGFPSFYDWSDNGALSHDYNVGGNSTDTVIDWYVSPPLDFTSPGSISMKVLTGGFSPPTPDNCELWFGTNNPDPSSGNFTLIGNLSYMQPQYQWLDTIIDIPFVSDSGYVAFKYKTIGAAWMTYSIDSITISSNPVGLNKPEHSDKISTVIIPNPIVSLATIHFDSELQNGQLDFYNIQAQKVKSISGIVGKEYKFYRNELPAGSYILVLSQEESILSRKKVLITE